MTSSLRNNLELTLDQYRGDPTMRIVTVNANGDLSIYEARPRNADGIIILHWIDGIYNSISERVVAHEGNRYRLSKFGHAMRMINTLCDELGWIHLSGAREGWRLTRCPESFQAWAELDIACKIRRKA